MTITAFGPCAWQPISTAPPDESTIVRWHRIWKCEVSVQRNNGRVPGYPEWITATKDQTWPEDAFLPYWRRPTAPPPAAAAALPVDVTAGDWVLEDAGGNRLSVLRLQPDGRVEGGRETEASWRTKDDGIVLLHRSGRPTARFELFQYRAGHWTLFGAPLNNPSAPLFLKQA